MSAIVEKDLAGNPKGLAMIEFEEESARKTALTLSGLTFLGCRYMESQQCKHSPVVLQPSRLV